MKKLLFFAVLLIYSCAGYSQAYIPMPSNNAAWRYRSIIDANIVTVSDFLLFVNGQDTVIGGNTYYQVFSRSNNQVGSPGFNPPVITCTATVPDGYFGGIRENNKQIYFISGTIEQLIFDFNAVVGSYIPSPSSTLRVVSIDSILIGSVYHKRYNTTDSTYYVIEGVGSSKGLVPDLVDGTGIVVFHCFTSEPDTTWSPNASIPCTYIYQYVYNASVKAINNNAEVKIYPNPVNDILRVNNASQSSLYAVIFNFLGQVIWSGEIDSSVDIPVSNWAKGVYFMQCKNDREFLPVEKIVVE